MDITETPDDLPRVIEFKMSEGREAGRMRPKNADTVSRLSEGFRPIKWEVREGGLRREHGTHRLERRLDGFSYCPVRGSGWRLMAVPEGD